MRQWLSPKFHPYYKIIRGDLKCCIGCIHDDDYFLVSTKCSFLTHLVVASFDVFINNLFWWLLILILNFPLKSCVYVHEMKEISQLRMIQTSKESIIKQKILNVNKLSQKIYSKNIICFELTNPRRYQLQYLCYIYLLQN